MAYLFEQNVLYDQRDSRRLLKDEHTFLVFTDLLHATDSKRPLTVSDYRSDVGFKRHAAVSHLWDR